jgi:hypothetical protein
MEPIEGFETSAINTQTPGKHPKEKILHTEHDESFKIKYYYGVCTTDVDASTPKIGVCSPILPLAP